MIARYDNEWRVCNLLQKFLRLFEFVRSCAVCEVAGDHQRVMWQRTAALSKGGCRLGLKETPEVKVGDV